VVCFSMLKLDGSVVGMLQPHILSYIAYNTPLRAYPAFHICLEMALFHLFEEVQCNLMSHFAFATSLFSFFL
jgi:hypothetical protein